MPLEDAQILMQNVKVHYKELMIANGFPLILLKNIFLKKRSQHLVLALPKMVLVGQRSSILGLLNLLQLKNYLLDFYHQKRYSE